jgi:rRNA maturation RNase YbeY
MEFAFRTTVRGEVPRLSFEKIAKEILGDTYSLSLVLCGDTLGRRLNKQYRNKTYRPNVLSFPLDRTHGEIFLNIRQAEREVREHNSRTKHLYASSLRKRIQFLFVHACLHLKGLDHGNRMEALERSHMAR